MEQKKPNILMLYVDDLGYGDLGCYGAMDIPTPNLDALAAGGLRFLDAYSTCPVCTPARYSLLTGQYPCRKQGIDILTGDAKALIPDDAFTLPRLLKSQGYHTGIVGKWHLGLGDGQGPTDWNRPVLHTPLDVGFDECFIFPATADRVPCVYFDGRNVLNLDPEDPIEVSYCRENPYPEMPTGRDHPELLKMQASHGHDQAIVNGVGRIGYMRGGRAALWKDEDLADTFLDRAKQFVNDHAREPFFLYYAMHQPHVPRLPHPRFAGATSLGPRGDVIVEMDWCVGQIMNTLKEQDLLENTIVIFSSDNGPVLDDGYQDRAYDLNLDHRPAGPLRGGKYSRFEGGIRVPFLLSWPGTVKPGVSSAVVSQVDLLASAAALLGTSVPDCDSENHLDAFLGKDSFGREILYAEKPDGSRVLRRGRWVYIEPSQGISFSAATRTETAASRDPQLYNLDYDLGQVRNLAERHPEVVRELAAEMEKITGRC